MNGEMLHQLRKIAEGDENVPQPVANQLMVSGMIQISKEVEGLGERLDEHVEEQRGQIGLIDEKLDELLKRTEDIPKNAEDIAELKENYFVQIGSFMKKSPRASGVIALALFLLIHAWFIAEIRTAIIQSLTGATDLLDLLGF